MGSNRPVCVEDFEVQAKNILDRRAWCYYSAGADSEATLRSNRSEYLRYRIRPRMLRGIDNVSTVTTVLGHRVGSPIGMSPVGYQAMAHPDGELATSKVNSNRNGCMILSTLSNKNLEEVAKAADISTASDPSPVLWFQLYIFKNRRATEQLLKRVYAAGYKAIVLTIDTPVIGKRRVDEQNSFTIPSHLEAANMTGLKFNELSEPKDSINGKKIPPGGGSALAQLSKDLLDNTITWEDIAWLKNICQLPIVLKGILTGEDAKLAVSYGAAAVMVSNHGGRQLDSAPSTIEVLSEIVKAVDGQIEVYLDGGIREGTDVIKALALGARAVFLGRPIVWGLAYKGEEGLQDLFNIIDNELRLTMILCGCKDVQELDASYVKRVDYFPSEHPKL